jgi:hypothetical protein
MANQAEYLMQDFAYCSANFEVASYVMHRGGKHLLAEDITQGYKVARFDAVIEVALWREQSERVRSDGIFLARGGLLFHTTGDWPTPQASAGHNLQAKKSLKQSWEENGITYHRELTLWIKGPPALEATRAALSSWADSAH